MQFGQIDGVRSSSQARALFRKSLESSAVAALTDVQRWLMRHVFHESDTARTQDAPVGNVNDVSAKVLSRIEALGFAIARIFAAFLVGVILKLTFTRLIADGTIQRMIDEQHLEHSLAGVE